MHCRGYLNSPEARRHSGNMSKAKLSTQGHAKIRSYHGRAVEKRRPTQTFVNVIAINQSYSRAQNYQKHAASRMLPPADSAHLACLLLFGSDCLLPSGLHVCFTVSLLQPTLSSSKNTQE